MKKLTDYELGSLEGRLDLLKRLNALVMERLPAIRPEPAGPLWPAPATATQVLLYDIQKAIDAEADVVAAGLNPPPPKRPSLKIVE